MRRALLGVVVVTACATPSPEAQRRAEAEELARFSSALAHAGMSVPLPPRRCEEPTGALRWNDEVGCLDGSVDDGGTSVVIYARALVRERLGSTPEARANERGHELADAYLRKDERFASLALAVERDFDGKRAGVKPDAKAPVAKKPALVVDKVRAPAKKDERPDAAPTDAGPPPAEEPSVDVATVVDGGAGPSLRERLIGIWVDETGPGRMVHVFHLCADGNARVKPESSDAAIAELIGDIPATLGTWELIEGEAPKVRFTWAGGEPVEGEVRSLSDDGVTFDFGEVVTTTTRRPGTPSCE
ncbi:MAG: hypothetical protein IT383_13530 [Deltaproteobacteria bacterium]|nr:hypothetical protein [Deltaproteobacteria bacterium]